MLQPRKELFTPEGLATYKNIIDQDEFYFEDGKVPLIYNSHRFDNGKYAHQELFQVLECKFCDR